MAGIETNIQGFGATEGLLAVGVKLFLLLNFQFEKLFVYLLGVDSGFYIC